MKPCWRNYGLTERGAERADLALPTMMALVSRVGATVALVVLDEAHFRLVKLPNRTEEYQRRYLKENADVPPRKQSHA